MADILAAGREHDAAGARAGDDRRHEVWPAFDGIRGLLCVVVLGFHLYPPLAWGGPLTLEVFCVLSGVVIASTLWSDVERTGRLRLGAYAMRRSVRLLPGLAAMLAGFVVLAAVAATPAWGDVDRDALVTLLFAANLTRAAGEPFPLLFGHTWSVALEAQFYVLLPIVVTIALRVTRRPLPIAAVAAGLAAASFAVRHALDAAGAPLARVYNGPDARLAALLLGAAIGLARFDPRARAWMARRLGGPRVLGGSTLLLGASFFVPWKAMGLLVPALTATACLSVPLLVAAATPGSGPVHRLLVHPIAQWLGRVSYALFLWHYPMFGVLFFAGLHVAQVAALGIPLSLAAAALSSRFVEQPARAWVVRRTRPRPAPAIVLAPTIAS